MFGQVDRDDADVVRRSSDGNLRAILKAYSIGPNDLNRLTRRNLINYTMQAVAGRNGRYIIQELQEKMRK